MKPTYNPEEEIKVAEVWKDVKDFERQYQVSNLGRVRSLDRNIKVSLKYTSIAKLKGEIRKVYYNMWGYQMLGFTKDGKEKKFTVHRLVAKAFIPNPHNKPQVNHKNGVKDDNRVENLEWCTQVENMEHAWKTGLIKSNKGELSGKSKLNEKQVRVLKWWKRINPEIKIREIQIFFPISQSSIYKILSGTAWSHVSL